MGQHKRIHLYAAGVVACARCMRLSRRTLTSSLVQVLFGAYLAALSFVHSPARPVRLQGPCLVDMSWPLTAKRLASLGGFAFLALTYLLYRTPYGRPAEISRADSQRHIFSSRR